MMKRTAPLLIVRAHQLWRAPSVVQIERTCSSLVTGGGRDKKESILQQSQHHQHRSVATKTPIVLRKGAKMGQHLQSLEEQAHRKEHEEAVARRKAKKSRKKEHRHEAEDDELAEAVAAPVATEEQDLEEIEFDQDDDKFHSHDENDENAVPTLPDPKQVRERMMKVVSKLEQSFKNIRGNEPTPDLFEHIIVEAYGERTHLNNVAQVVIVSPTLVTVTCFDPSLAKDVRNAIRDAPHFDGSLNPLLEEDGQVKVPVPRPSAETRQNTVKQLKKQAEAGRQRLRRIRRAAMDLVKKGRDGKLEGISKDDAFRVGKEIDQTTEEVTEVLNDVGRVTNL
jgi:ribosome recycling factor